MSGYKNENAISIGIAFLRIVCYRLCLFSFFCGIILLIISCANPSNEGQDRKFSALDNGAKEQAASNVVTSYWKDYDFKDTARIFDAKRGGKDFVDFIVALNLKDSLTRDLCIRNMLDETSAQPKVFRHYLKMYMDYLGNPNSALRNEISYMAVLNYLKDKQELSVEEREKYKVKLALINKNRPGQLATDFFFINKFGAEQRLYHVRSEYKLLIFYDPGCSSCGELLSQLRSSYILLEQQEEKKLQFVAVVPWDAYAVWKDYQSEIPLSWGNGYDKSGRILEDELYSIQAYPTLYLIGKDNSVLLKDTNVLSVELYLKQHSLI